jgi:hypothetical protein
VWYHRSPEFSFQVSRQGQQGKISKEEFEAGYELVQTFLYYEGGYAYRLCNLLRVKYLDEKKKPKTNTNLVVELGHAWCVSTTSSGNPDPSGLPQSFVTPKCDPQTLTMGCSPVDGEGLQSAVGLDNDVVFANFMKDPELWRECEILITGLGGHPLGRIDDIDHYYCVKFGESGHWTKKEFFIDDKDDQTPVPCEKIR